MHHASSSTVAARRARYHSIRFDAGIRHEGVDGSRAYHLVDTEHGAMNGHRTSFFQTGETKHRSQRDRRDSDAARRCREGEAAGAGGAKRPADPKAPRRSSSLCSG